MDWSTSGWDQNRSMPAYRIDGELVPFHSAGPISAGRRQRRLACGCIHGRRDQSALAACRRNVKERIREKASFFLVPHQFRATGGIDPRGRIDPHGDVDLRDIRRPAFFGAAPWNEQIAEVENRTSVVEFEVPRDPHEILHLGLTGPVRLRGWHIAGDGVPDGKGGRTRALAMLTAGRSIETTVIHHPDDPACVWSAEVQGWLPTSYPDEVRANGGVRGAAVAHLSARPRSRRVRCVDARQTGTRNLWRRQRQQHQ